MNLFKIDRCPETPASLEIEKKKKNGKYNRADVLEQLKKDSYGKCYICEIKVSDPEVEHRLPHYDGRFPDRKFDWNNLFLSSRHCNSVKEKSRYAEGIIDCCVMDPETVIDHELREDCVCVTAFKDDEAVLLTAELINEVFNSRKSGTLCYASEFRMNRLQETMNNLYCILDEYYNDMDDQFLSDTIIVMISRDTEFSVFTRGHIRRNKELFVEFYRVCFGEVDQTTGYF